MTRIISPTSAMDLIRLRVTVFFLFIWLYLQIQMGLHRSAAVWTDLCFLHRLQSSNLAQDTDHFTVVGHGLYQILSNVVLLHKHSSIMGFVRVKRAVCTAGWAVFCFSLGRRWRRSISNRRCVSPPRCGYYSTRKRAGEVGKLTFKWKILTFVNQI